MRHLSSLLAGIVLAGSGANASAQVVYDSITGATMSNSAWYTGIINYPNPVGVKAGVAALQFTDTSTGFISAVTRSANGASAYSVGIYTDNAGLIGSNIESLSLSGSSTAYTFSQGTYAAGATLNAGSKYWLVMGDMTAPTETWQYMAQQNPTATTNYLSQLPGTQFSTVGGTYFSGYIGFVLGAQVTVTAATAPVPEPGTGALMIAGLLGMGAVARWRTKG